MRRERDFPGPTTQRGGALLVMLAMLGLGAIAVVAGRIMEDAKASMLRSSLTTMAFQEAKDALVARAAMDANRPGSLPCPDRDGDGSAELMIGNDCPAYVGLLPWRTLHLRDLRDQYGERLWYALSRNLRDHPTAEPINSETATDLTLDGLANHAVAIVFSPGPPISGQVRSEPSPLLPADPTQYLDLSNNDGDTDFVSMGPVSSFNDRVLAISHDELFRAVQKRVAGEVREAFATYYAVHRFFPLSAGFDDDDCLGRARIDGGACSSSSDNHGRVPAFPDTAWDISSLLNGSICLPSTSIQNAACSDAGSSENWFQRNAWRELVHYAVSRQCSDAARPDCSGVGSPLQLDGQPGKVVVIVAGRTVSAQVRADASDRGNEGNYLEDENLASPLDRYVTRIPVSSGTPFNDVSVSIN